MSDINHKQKTKRKNEEQKWIYIQFIKSKGITAFFIVNDHGPDGYLLCQSFQCFKIHFHFI